MIHGEYHECLQCHSFIITQGWGSHRGSAVCDNDAYKYDSGFLDGVKAGRQEMHAEILKAMEEV